MMCYEKFEKYARRFIKKHLIKKEPLKDYTTIKYISEKLRSRDLPKEDVRNLFEMFTTPGWEVFKNYMQFLQRLIEKRIISLKITDEESIALKIEWSVYQKIFSVEQEVRKAFNEEIGNQSRKETQK